MTTTQQARDAGKAVVKTYLWIKFGIPAAICLAILLVIALLLMLAGAAGGKPDNAAGCGGTSPASVAVVGKAAGLTPEQQSNAAAIAGVALARGLGERGVLIGIATALAEASLINVGHGDAMGPSSIGLFQQMPGWGPLSVRTDPAGSAGLFYDALLKLNPSWTTMSIPAAAQAVEQSEFDGHTNWPGRGVLPLGQNYADQMVQAQAITTALMAEQPDGAVVPVAAQQAACAPAPTGPVTPFTGQMNLSQDPTTYGWVRAANQVPFSWQGHQFGKVAAGTEALWSAMLAELVPQIPGGLNSDLGCFENRPNVNSPGNWSIHSWGLACDLNSGVNSNGVTAASLQGRQFALPMNTGTIVAKYCMIWGGEFKGTPDPMHVEIHCTPQQVAQMVSAPLVTQSGGTP